MDTMTLESPYRVMQLDASGDVLTDDNVLARNYASVIRGVTPLESDTTRVVVLDADGNKAGEATADYCRHNARR